MTKEKILTKYNDNPVTKTNPHKRRLPRLPQDQWERLVNLSVWKGGVAPTQLPKGINAIPL